MTKRAMLLLSVVSLAVASAASNFSVSLPQTTTVNGTEFKAGDAKVELKDNKVIIKQGKATAELPVRVETNDHKYVYTAVGMKDNHIKDIVVGGSTTHILFESNSDTSSIPTGGRQ